MCAAKPVGSVIPASSLVKIDRRCFQVSAATSAGRVLRGSAAWRLIKARRVSPGAASPNEAKARASKLISWGPALANLEAKQPSCGTQPRFIDGYKALIVSKD